MDSPPDGYTASNSYYRNAQPIGNGLFLCDSQRGTQGKGKMWSPTVLAPNPKPRYPGDDRTWVEIGIVKIAKGKWVRPNTFKAYVYYYGEGVEYFHVDATLSTELAAVQFMVRNATELFKP